MALFHGVHCFVVYRSADVPGLKRRWYHRFVSLQPQTYPRCSFWQMIPARFRYLAQGLPGTQENSPESGCDGDDY